MPPETSAFPRESWDRLRRRATRAPSSAALAPAACGETLVGRNALSVACAKARKRAFFRAQTTDEKRKAWATGAVLRRREGFTTGCEDLARNAQCSPCVENWHHVPAVSSVPLRNSALSRPLASE